MELVESASGGVAEQALTLRGMLVLDAAELTLALAATARAHLALRFETQPALQRQDSSTMTPAWIGALIVALLTTACGGFGWWMAGREPPCGTSRARRAASTLLAMGVALPLSAYVVNESVSQGDFACFRCGRCVHRVTAFGIPVPFAITRGGFPRGANGDAYDQAFVDAVKSDHLHALRPVGCHYSGLWLGRTVSCTMIGPCAWFRELPLVTDRTLATASALRFAQSSMEDKEDVVRNYDFALNDGTTADEHFAAWRARWLLDHPTWP